MSLVETMQEKAGEGRANFEASMLTPAFVSI